MTTEEKEHTSHCEYPVKQDAIEAIGSVLDLLVRLAVSKRHDDERPEDEDKSYGNIQNALTILGMQRCCSTDQQPRGTPKI